MTSFGKTITYLIRRSGEVFGPFNSNEIKEMIQNAALNGEDEIAQQELMNWQMIKNTNIWYSNQ